MVFSCCEHRIDAPLVRKAQRTRRVDDESERKIFVRSARTIQLFIYIRPVRIAGLHFEAIHGRSRVECACGKTSPAGHP